MRAAVFNHPNVSAIVTTGLVVGVHALLTKIDRLCVSSPVELLGGVAQEGAARVTLYLGVSGVAGVLGGFAGVLVVFAMTQGLKRFATMRLEGGEDLEANWLHPVVASFVAAFSLVGATALEIGGEPPAGAWVAEAGLVLAVHSAHRMVWLLSKLIVAVRREDEDNAVPRPDIKDVVPNAFKG